MKKNILAFIILLVVFISCKKHNDGGTCSCDPVFSAKDSTWIGVDSCKSIAINATSFIVCFDSLLNDSRCSYGAMCFSIGFATARFKIINGNKQDFITLGIWDAGNYKSDTILSGVKFHLDSLLPHPAINIFYLYSAYKAKIVIGQ